MAILPAPNETIARYDQHPYLIVVDAKQPKHIFPEHLGGIPTPALIDACNDGKAHEAWRTADGIWRLKDEAYDRAKSDFPGEYTLVYVGRAPDYEEGI